MTANEMTFGVEIECLVPSGVPVAIGEYHVGTQIVQLPHGWRGQRDGSLHAEPGFKTVEIVSPVLKGAEGLRQVKVVLAWIREQGGKVNRTCGLHVHVGVNRNPKNLKAVVTAAANLEKAIYATTGTKAREQGAYCKPISTNHNAKAGRLGLVDRYHVVNCNTNKPTIEFRAFAGTLNFTKVCTYIRLAVGFVEKALGLLRLPNWTAPAIVAGKGNYYRGSEGASQVNRLQYWMGWKKGKEAKTFGAVGLEDEGLPTIEQGMKELNRLALKYDGRVDANATTEAPAEDGHPF